MHSFVIPPRLPVLQRITLTGPTLEVLADCIIAIAGADMSVTVDGQPLDNYHSVHAFAGSVIRFGRRRGNGARAYLLRSTARISLPLRYQ